MLMLAWCRLAHTGCVPHAAGQLCLCRSCSRHKGATAALYRTATAVESACAVSPRLTFACLEPLLLFCILLRVDCGQQHCLLQFLDCPLPLQPLLLLLLLPVVREAACLLGSSACRYSWRGAG